MLDVEKVVKATVNGEAKEKAVTVSTPESIKEAIDKFGKEKVLGYFVRMLVTDKTNAERVIMKGGEAKEKRVKEKALLEAILADDDLRARVAEETGIEL